MYSVKIWVHKQPNWFMVEVRVSLILDVPWHTGTNQPDCNARGHFLISMLSTRIISRSVRWLIWWLYLQSFSTMFSILCTSCHRFGVNWRNWKSGEAECPTLAEFARLHADKICQQRLSTSAKSTVSVESTLFQKNVYEYWAVYLPPLSL